MAKWGSATWGGFVWGDITSVPPSTFASPAQIAAILAGEGLAELLHYEFEQRTKSFGFVARLTDAIVTGSGNVSLDNLATGAGRTVTCTARVDDLPMSFDPETSYLAVFADLWINGMNYFERYSLGLFRLDAPAETLTPGGSTVTLRGADLMTELLAAQEKDPYLIAAGTDYAAAVRTLVLARGLNEVIANTGIVTPTDQVWKPNTSDADIANETLLGVNYFPLYFDPVGKARIKQRIDPFGETIAVTWSTLAEPRMILTDSIARATASQRYPNRCVVRVDDPLRAPFGSYAENDDPSSSMSVPVRGNISAITKDVATALNQPTAQDVANYELLLAAAQSKTLTIHTRPDPRRLAHEVYQLTIGTEEVATRWLVLGWDLPLTPDGKMTHRLAAAKSVAINVGAL